MEPGLSSEESGAAELADLQSVLGAKEITVSTKIFCIDHADQWVHVYTVDDLSKPGALPIVGDLFDVNGKKYNLQTTNIGYQLVAAASNLTGANAQQAQQDAVNTRLNTVFTYLANVLDARLACQVLTETERQDRRSTALTELNKVRGFTTLADRFTAMQEPNQFGHTAAVPPNLTATRGGWLHNLFCH